MIDQSLPTIRQATEIEAPLVSSVLREAASWLRDRGMPLWRDDDLLPERLSPDVHAGMYHLALVDGAAAGTVKLQPSDPLIWPDAASDDALYVHRLAVRRRFAGGQLSAALLRYAAERTRAAGRTHLRLDCDASRLRLRELYVSLGFHAHGDHVAGSFHVARFEQSVLEASHVLPKRSSDR